MIVGGGFRKRGKKTLIPEFSRCINGGSGRELLEGGEKKNLSVKEVETWGKGERENKRTMETLALRCIQKSIHSKEGRGFERTSKSKIAK